MVAMTPTLPDPLAAAGARPVPAGGVPGAAAR